MFVQNLKICQSGWFQFFGWLMWRWPFRATIHDNRPLGSLFFLALQISFVLLSCSSFFLLERHIAHKQKKKKKTTGFRVIWFVLKFHDSSHSFLGAMSSNPTSKCDTIFGIFLSFARILSSYSPSTSPFHFPFFSKAISNF